MYQLAAVLVPLVVRGAVPTVLMTRRTDHLHHHPGQISFPGGRVEEADTSPIDTALRETQEEIDRLWDAFCEEGEPSQCGWVTDKYGLSWQLVPNVLNELLLTKDPEQAARVNQAMYRMQKLVISELVASYHTPKAE